MPSSTTSNYNLSQWEADDKVLRTDFNADNAKIDAALKSEVNARTALAGQVAKKAEQSALNSEVNTRTSQMNNINNTLVKKGNCQIYYTSYVGDGQTTRSLTFPKRPLLVFIMGNEMMLRAVYGYEMALVGNQGSAGNRSNAVWSGNTLTWTFINGSYSNDMCNNKDKTYYVVALMDAST